MEIQDSKASPASTENHFSSRIAFLVSAIGCSVGFGNVWRFPFLCQKYGGAAFLIPYLIVLFLVVLPIALVEFGVGQMSQGGSVKAFAVLGRRYGAVGLNCFNSFIISNYYTLLHAICLVYLANCFASPMPWNLSQEDMDYCSSLSSSPDACSESNFCFMMENECHAAHIRKAQYFWNSRISKADYTRGIEAFRGWLLLGETLTWLAVFLFSVGGAKILGYVNFITTGLPAFILILLAILGMTLNGAFLGVKAYIGKIDFSVLFTEPSVWTSALGQAIFSMGAAQGTMAAYAAHNKKDQNFVEDAVFVSIGDFTFSFVAGFTVFTVTGFLATNLGVGLNELPLEGSGLIFQTYPVGVSAALRTPWSNIVIFLFFMTLWFLGVSTSLGHAEAVSLSIYQSRWYHSLRWPKSYGLLAFIVVNWLISFLFSTDLGFNILDTMDNLSANLNLQFCLLSEAIVAGWLFALETQFGLCGKKAVLVHVQSFILSCFIGPVILIYGGSVWFLGLVVWILIAGGGFVFAFWTAKRIANDGTLYSKKDVIYNLTISSTDILRSKLNENACEGKFFHTPAFWGVLVKYILTPSLISSWVLGLSSYKNTYGYPGGSLGPSLWWVHLIVSIWPWTLIASITFFTMFPRFFEFMLPPDNELVHISLDPVTATRNKSKDYP